MLRFFRLLLTATPKHFSAKQFLILCTNHFHTFSENLMITSATFFSMLYKAMQQHKLIAMALVRSDKNVSVWWNGPDVRR